MQMRFTLRCVQCMATSVLRDQQYTFGSVLSRHPWFGGGGIGRIGGWLSSRCRRHREARMLTVQLSCNIKIIHYKYIAFNCVNGTKCGQLFLRKITKNCCNKMSDFTAKMHQTFGGRAPPGPGGGA